MSSDPHRDRPVREFGRPIRAASGAVILLHGRGGSAEDILTLASDLYLPQLVYLAPQAAGNSWYPNSFLLARAVVVFSGAGYSFDRSPELGEVERERE